MKNGLELVKIDRPIFPLAAGAVPAALLVTTSVSDLGVEVLGVFEEVVAEEFVAGGGLHPANALRVASREARSKQVRWDWIIVDSQSKGPSRERAGRSSLGGGETTRIPNYGLSLGLLCLEFPGRWLRRALVRSARLDCLSLGPEAGSLAVFFLKKGSNNSANVSGGLADFILGLSLSAGDGKEGRCPGAVFETAERIS